VAIVLFTRVAMRFGQCLEPPEQHLDREVTHLLRYVVPSACRIISENNTTIASRRRTKGASEKTV